VTAPEPTHLGLLSPQRTERQQGVALYEL
jgi:hypothetical protein